MELSMTMWQGDDWQALAGFMNARPSVHFRRLHAGVLRSTDTRSHLIVLPVEPLAAIDFCLGHLRDDVDLIVDFHWHDGLCVSRGRRFPETKRRPFISCRFWIGFCRWFRWNACAYGGATTDAAPAHIPSGPNPVSERTLPCENWCWIWPSSSTRACTPFKRGWGGHGGPDPPRNQRLASRFLRCLARWFPFLTALRVVLPPSGRAGPAMRCGAVPVLGMLRPPSAADQLFHSVLDGIRSLGRLHTFEIHGGERRNQASFLARAKRLGEGWHTETHKGIRWVPVSLSKTQRCSRYGSI